MQQQERLRRGLTIFVKLVLENMMGYVALNTIMQKVVTDHGQSKLDEFRDILTSMLDVSLYERNILSAYRAAARASYAPSRRHAPSLARRLRAGARPPPLTTRRLRALGACPLLAALPHALARACALTSQRGRLYSTPSEHHAVVAL